MIGQEVVPAPQLLWFYPVALLVPLLLGGLALAVMASVSAVTARRQRLAASQPPARAARILVHSINDDRCTGCDACVAVCPTNVLDLIDNKSRVVRFQDCIQCEQCMWACPTEALVMHPEGTEPPPLTMPELDSAFQTAVPGQYLIGEVAGKPLVKNAANLGRGVVEHMVQQGLRPSAPRRAEGSDASDVSVVDVCIVGSGPGGLSAALTCVHRGLSYVVLEKEQMIASTVARYPKGKLVMAEPYDVANYSFLPVFDSTKEELVGLWQDLVERVGLRVRLGEAVEQVQRRADGTFDVRTTVAQYRAQRVVLATGLRGKPRTLGVPGENQPHVFSLLEDPDDWAGRAVTVVGGGDSALEAAMALADAGAKVVLSYRGRQFSRAQPKNKEAIASYAAQRRIKVKFQTQVAEFGPDFVTLRFHDGSHKRYPCQGAFVLIGADPPVKWLEKLGVQFVQRPHQHQLGKSDEFVRRFVPEVVDCPSDAAAAAALATGQLRPEQIAAEPPARTGAPRIIESGRKFIRSASAIFTSARKLDRPMPLSEFARRSRRHAGNGRRDALDPAERTRVLRMLRDDGARLADEDSRVYAVDEPSGIEHGWNDPSPVPDWDQSSPFSKGSPAPEQAPLHLPPDELAVDGAPIAPREALIVGLAKAHKRAGTPRARRRSPAPAPRRRIHDDPTVQVDALPDDVLASAARAPTHDDPTVFALPAAPQPPPRFAVDDFDEATRAVDIDPNALLAAAERPRGRAAAGPAVIEDEPTAMADLSQLAATAAAPERPRRAFLPVKTISDVEFDFDE